MGAGVCGCGCGFKWCRRSRNELKWSETSTCQLVLCFLLSFLVQMLEGKIQEARNKKVCVRVLRLGGCLNISNKHTIGLWRKKTLDLDEDQPHLSMCADAKYTKTEEMSLNVRSCLLYWLTLSICKTRMFVHKKRARVEIVRHPMMLHLFDVILDSTNACVCMIVLPQETLKARAATAKSR